MLFSGGPPSFYKCDIVRPCRRNLLRLLALAGLFALAVASAFSQRTFYVDPDGDDGNDGRSESYAWRTLARITKTTFNSGDQILLKRGAAWREALEFTGSGSSGSPVVFAAYGSGSDPVVDLGGPLPGWSNAGNWYDEGGNVWSYTATDFGDPGPGRMWFDGDEYGISGSWAGNNHAGTGSGTGTATPNATMRFYYDNAGGGHTLYVYATGNPASVYGSIEISNLLPPIYWSNKSYVTFRNIQFRRGWDCISVKNCDHFTWESCRIGWGTPGYLLVAEGGSDYGVVRRCNFNREDYIQHTWEYSGSAMTNLGRNDGLAIRCGSYWEADQDTFLTCGHAGVSVNGRTDESGPTPSGHTESKYNKIHNCVFKGGGDYDRAFGAVCVGDYALDAYNEFYANLIDGCSTQSQINGMENKVYCNVFVNQGWIPTASVNEAWRTYCLAIGTDADNGSSSAAMHLQVFNNTFVGSQSSALCIYPGPMRASVKNNLFYNCGIRNLALEPYSAFVIWSGATTDTVQNNLFYSSKTTTPIIAYQVPWQENPPAAERSVGQLEDITYPYSYTDNAGHQFTARNVVSDNLGTDPKLGSDYQLVDGSPAIETGVNVGLSTDFLGQPMKSVPDIGAIQHTGSNPQKPPLPGAPVPLTPANGAALKAPEALLSWTPASTSDRCRLQVADDYFITIKRDTILPAGVSSFKFGPVNAAVGDYTWRVADLNSAGQGPWSTPRTFAYVPDTIVPPPVIPLPAPAPVAPPAAATTNPGTVKFVWTSSGAGAAYRLQLARDSSFTVFVADSALTDTSLSLAFASPPATLWWRAGVRQTSGTMTYGAKRSLVITIAPPPPPPPPPPANRTVPLSVSPPAGFQTLPVEMKFVWSSSGDGALYRWQFAADSSFVSTTIDATLSDTLMVIDLDPVAGVFWWRAAVRQPDGSFSFGSKRSITVKLAPGTLPLPLPLSPPEGSVVNPGDVMFQWHRSAPAASYRFQLARDSAFTLFVTDTTLADTSLPVPIPAARANLRWRVGVRQPDSTITYGASLALSVVMPAPTLTLTVAPDSLPKGGGTVRLTWSSTNAQSIRIDQGLGAVPLQGSRDVPVTGSTAFTATAYGWGQVRVASASVMVRNSAPPGVVLLFPQFDAVLLPPTVPLVWNRIPDAVRYCLQVSSDSLFTALAVNDTSLADTMRVLSGISDGARMFWRVAARNSFGLGPFSQPSVFSVKKTALPAGSIALSSQILPPGGGTVRLEWSAVNIDSVRIEPAVGTFPPKGSLEVYVTTSRTFTLSSGSLVLAQTTIAVRDGFIPTLLDVTGQSTPMAAWTSAFLERIADKTMLPPGSTDAAGAYSSRSGDSARSSDWVGYQFPARREIAGLVFQDGPHTAGGGWFDTLAIQVRTGDAWSDVPASQVTPPYRGKQGPSYETYIFRFPAVQADAIRLFGTPGGPERFVTVGELRAFSIETAPPPPPSQTPPPSDYGLEPNYPNPFNPSTKIVFRLPERNHVHLSVFNVLGEEVDCLVDTSMEPGIHTVEFSGQNLPAGVYFFRIQMGSFTRAGKMLLLR